MNQQMLSAVEAEQSVIGALLRDNDAIDNMGALMPQQFYRDDHRVIFGEVLRQIKGQQRCDVVTVGLALAGMPDIMGYLNAIAQSVPSAVNIDRYAELVRDRALRRALLSTFGDMAELVNTSSPRPAIELLDQAQGMLAALAESRVKGEPLKASEAMLTYIGKFDQRMDGIGAGMPLGFDDLDELLTGGPRNGALVIVAGRPSMGKTALAMNIATRVADTDPVLILSQEMQNDDLLDREIAQIGRIPLGNVIKGTLSDEEWVRFGHANAKLATLQLYLDDTPALTLMQVRSKARIIKRKHGLKLLVIDYLQLMSGDGDPKKNRNTQVEEISRGLKALAKELGIVIIALSQLNRNGANKSRPQLSDLRDSGAIEQDADIVIFVHREEVDNPQTHMKGFADVFVAKNRQGRVDDALLEYQGSYTLFVNTKRQRPSEAAPTKKRHVVTREF